MKLNALKVHNRRQNELFIEKLEKEREEYEKMTDEEKSEYNRKKAERRERLENVMAGINMISEIADYGYRAFLKGKQEMKIENGKIIEATESELYSVYLQRELYELYDFHDYLKRCEDAGTKIVGKKENEK